MKSTHELKEVPKALEATSPRIRMVLPEPSGLSLKWAKDCLIPVVVGCIFTLAP